MLRPCLLGRINALPKGPALGTGLRAVIINFTERSLQDQAPPVARSLESLPMTVPHCGHAGWKRMRYAQLRSERSKVLHEANIQSEMPFLAPVSITA